jgi:hypothetical protein
VHRPPAGRKPVRSLRTIDPSGRSRIVQQCRPLEARHQPTGQRVGLRRETEAVIAEIEPEVAPASIGMSLAAVMALTLAAVTA